MWNSWYWEMFGAVAWGPTILGNGVLWSGVSFLLWLAFLGRRGWGGGLIWGDLCIFIWGFVLGSSRSSVCVLGNVCETLAR